MTVVYILDVSVFKDKNIFELYLNDMPQYRKEKIAKIKSENGKRLSLGAGVLLKYGIKKYNPLCNCVDLIYNKQKKPYIKNYEKPYFNISHSGDMAVCAFSDSEIGCDIQKIKNVPQNIMKKICSSEEYNYLLSVDGGLVAEEFCRIWTIKESYVKFTGKGILNPADIVIPKGVCFKEYKTDGYVLTVCGLKDDFAEELKWVNLH
ncbi:MAG: 4'-phosphopantetheinyl transferase superfamily protein [Clostridia bacterium]|nr:4'-phosphopantetheinyl transferase superfamily protein [Clostridia bacterium]